FDLGGGSLECLAFRDRKISQAVSLPLGCVRLTDKFVADPAASFAHKSGADITDHIVQTIARSGFTFSLPAGAEAVVTGGTLTTVRTILGLRAGKNFEESNATITLAE